MLEKAFLVHLDPGLDEKRSQGYQIEPIPTNFLFWQECVNYTNHSEQFFRFQLILIDQVNKPFNHVGSSTCRDLSLHGAQIQAAYAEGVLKQASFEVDFFNKIWYIVL